MSQPSSIPHFNAITVEGTPVPQYGGTEAVLYSSADGKRLAGSFRESGTHTMVMPFDEFVYLIAGSVTLTLAGEEPLVLSAGDCAYLKEGQEVTWEMSDDFHDVTVLVSDKKIEY